MKTVSVRIDVEQAKKLHDVADQMAGGSINGMVQTAVDFLLKVIGPAQVAALVHGRPLEEILQMVADHWVDVEGTVYMAAFDETRERLRKQRQAVVTTRIAS